MDDATAPARHDGKDNDVTHGVADAPILGAGERSCRPDYSERWRGMMW